MALETILFVRCLGVVYWLMRLTRNIVRLIILLKKRITVETNHLVRDAIGSQEVSNSFRYKKNNLVSLSAFNLSDK